MEGDQGKRKDVLAKTRREKGSAQESAPLFRELLVCSAALLEPLLQRSTVSLPTVRCLVTYLRQPLGHAPLRLSSPPDYGRTGTLGPRTSPSPLHSTLFSAHDHKVGTDGSYPKRQKARMPKVLATQEEVSAMT